MSNQDSFVEKLFEQSGKYDVICRFFPGMALYALLAKFTKFNNFGHSTISDLIINTTIACVAGMCIDALGSFFRKFFVAEKTVGYREYLEMRDNVTDMNTAIKTNLNMLEHRRVMYQNIAIVLILLFVVKVCEILYATLIYRTCPDIIQNILIATICMCAMLLCKWKSRHIDEYKLKRIEIRRKEREETESEKQKIKYEYNRNSQAEEKS